MAPCPEFDTLRAGSVGGSLRGGAAGVLGTLRGASVGADLPATSAEPRARTAAPRVPTDIPKGARKADDAAPAGNKALSPQAEPQSFLPSPQPRTALQEFQPIAASNERVHRATAAQAAVTAPAGAAVTDES